MLYRPSRVRTSFKGGSPGSAAPGAAALALGPGDAAADAEAFALEAPFADEALDALWVVVVFALLLPELLASPLQEHSESRTNDGARTFRRRIGIHELIRGTPRLWKARQYWVGAWSPSPRSDARIRS